ncbi:hypothetical protein ACHAXS_011676 [Conticribra weissflogii]
MELTRSGQIKTGDQLRADRMRHGFCETCRVDPVRCFKIKRRFGGIIHERIPLTIEHKVHNGVCLQCHPDQDPIPRHGSSRRHNRNLFHPPRYEPPSPSEDSISRTERGPRSSSQGIWEGDAWVRTNSIPSIEGGNRRRSLMTRQGAQRDLGRSQDLTQSAPVNSNYFPDDDMEFDYEYDDNNSTRKNIFGEVIRRKSSKKYPKHSNGILLDDDGENAGGNCLPSRRSNHHGDNLRQRSEDQQSLPLAKDDHRDLRPRAPSERSGQQSISNLSAQFAHMQHFARNDNGVNPYKNYGTNEDDEDEEEQGQGVEPVLSPDQTMDELARIIAQACAKTPDLVRTFVLPANGMNLLPNSVLNVPVMDDDEISLVTMETALRGDDLTVISTSVKKFKTDSMPAINEESNDDAEAEASDQSAEARRQSSDQKTVASHLIREPSPPRDSQNEIESDAMDISTLREIVSDFSNADDDAGAIEVVSQAIIQDNSTNRSVDLALVCLTTLWVLARKSDTNKRKMIFEDRTFDAILEVMHLYAKVSSEIQTRACGILWSLAMDPNDRKHVAQLGGCDGILNAMLVHMEVESLQIMALGALKVISLDAEGQSTLRRKEAASIVADSMASHPTNATVQSEGCAILCNLAREANQFVHTVREREIEVVINAILSNPNSSDVVEGACFALLCFASSTENVDKIQRNPQVRKALEVSFQNHPVAVGEYVQTLLQRLQLYTAV